MCDSESIHSSTASLAGVVAGIVEGILPMKSCSVQATSSASLPQSPSKHNSLIFDSNMPIQQQQQQFKNQLNSAKTPIGNNISMTGAAIAAATLATAAGHHQIIGVSFSPSDNGVGGAQNTTMLTAHDMYKMNMNALAENMGRGCNDGSNAAGIGTTNSNGNGSSLGNMMGGGIGIINQNQNMTQTGNGNISQIINIDELIMENYALREKLKEITMDRDRLLCEVSNLRLELDMQELKRLPELER